MQYEGKLYGKVAGKYIELEPEPPKNIPLEIKSAMKAWAKSGKNDVFKFAFEAGQRKSDDMVEEANKRIAKLEYDNKWIADLFAESVLTVEQRDKRIAELEAECPNCGSREKDYHKTTGTLKSICCHPWHDSEGGGGE